MKNKISVCMATYNGEKYIKQQLDSILSQLRKDDEVIISDDHSSDNTLEIVKSMTDERIKIFSNKLEKGPIKNFENAISFATGDIIFLSDQDDIWRNDKVSVILNFFDKNKNITCVFSNAKIIDKQGNETGNFFFQTIPNLNFPKMILKNKFLGCTMAFKRNKDISLIPFTKNLPMHDWYIGLKHLQKGKVAFINETLIFYRRHGENVTSGLSAGLIQIIKWRFEIIKALLR